MSPVATRPATFCIAFAIVLLFGGGCSNVTNFVNSADPYHTEAYEDVCDAWSRHARIYRGLEVGLIVSATYRSEEYRRAYAEEYAEVHKLTPEAKQAFVEDQVAALAHGHEFVMGTHVPEEVWDDFQRADSMWKIQLANDQDERLAPIEIRQLKRQGKAGRGDAVKTHFFPYDTPWKSVYTVRFPSSIPGTNQPLVSEETRSIRLIITSVLGTAEMEWDLKDIEN